MPDKEIFPSRQNSSIQKVQPIESFLADSTYGAFMKGRGTQLPSPLLSAVVGIDSTPRPMNMQEIRGLGDTFTQNLLLKGMNPMTLNELVHGIESIADRAYGLRKMFLVAEGGQFKVNNPDFEANARLVFTWQLDNATPPDFLLSTAAVSSSNTSLLQLIAWSYKDGSYHFFERKNGMWGWAGNSFTAFHPMARGKGPFDSHINGGLVMKELKFPWGHWHSQSNTIPREIFGTTSEFNTNGLFAVLTGAEGLESIVKNGIRRWTKSRISQEMKDGDLNEPIHYFRQILTPTSINLVSSSIEFSRAQTTSIPIPSSFFFDVDCIEYASSLIDPLVEVVPGDRVIIDGAKYTDIVTRLRMHVNSENGIAREEGDTHFSFMVPERAFEDFEVCRQLVENEIITPRFLLSLIMVDFSSPVRSQAREGLLRYCPSKVDLSARFQLENGFLSSLSDRQIKNESPESEFLKYWKADDILALVKLELAAFISGIQNGLEEDAYREKLVRFAEFRKEQFRGRPLNEFESSTSSIEGDIVKLKMNKLGQIF